jgi:hypothetical protein
MPDEPRQRIGRHVIDPRGMIRLTHEGYDETTHPAYRREIIALLAEWSESSNRN